MRFSNSVVAAIYSGIQDKFKPNQCVRFCQFTDIDGPEAASEITVSMVNDRRYALLRFELGEIVLDCTLRIYARWFQEDQHFRIDLFNPKDFDWLCDTLVDEVLDGLRFGRTGITRQELACRKYHRDALRRRRIVSAPNQLTLW